MVTYMFEIAAAAGAFAVTFASVLDANAPPTGATNVVPAVGSVRAEEENPRTPPPAEPLPVEAMVTVYVPLPVGVQVTFEPAARFRVVRPGRGVPFTCTAKPLPPPAAIHAS